MGFAGSAAMNGVVEKQAFLGKLKGFDDSPLYPTYGNASTSIIKLTLKQYCISLLAIKDTISEEKRA